MKKLTATIFCILLIAVFAGTCANGTAGTECFQPGQIRVEHPNPSTTETFKCVTDGNGRHAHWLKVPNDCKGGPTSGPQFCAG